jgi:hypothetical protein
LVSEIRFPPTIATSHFCVSLEENLQKDSEKGETNQRSKMILFRQTTRDQKQTRRMCHAISADLAPSDENDLDAALEKIGKAAAFYDPARNNLLNAFEGSFVDATVLKEQMRRNFRIEFTPRELGALVNHCDMQGDGSVHCGSFLNEFFRIGRFERTASETRRKRLNTTIKSRKETFERSQAESYIKHHQAKIVLPGSTRRPKTTGSARMISKANDAQAPNNIDFFDEVSERLAKMDKSKWSRGYDWTSHA